MTTVSTERSDPADGERHAHVIVVGAGITGLSTAIMLLDAGRSVIVIEQDVPGALASGRNTGKATLLQGTRLATIRRGHSARLVRAYVDANRAGQQWLRRACERAGVEVREATAYSYAQSVEGLDAVDAEVRAGREAGLPMRRVNDVPDDVPFPLAGAAALDGQLALDPGELMRGLAELVTAGGGRLVKGVRALGVTASSPARVRTSAGEYTADQVVIATGAPMLNRGLYWAKTGGSRSMLVSFTMPSEAALPDGMYISVDQPVRSIRRDGFDLDGAGRLIVGGAGHRTGREPSTQELLDELIGWAQTWWPDATDPVHWAAQDYQSHNLVPFVGRMPRGRGRVWFATGYAKWGLTNGAAAGIRISHEMLGARRPDWGRVIGMRVSTPGDWARGIAENAKVGGSLARRWVGALRAPVADAAPPPPEGVGVVLRRGAHPVGVSTVGGETCEVSAVCTHLGGVLQWNDAECTWDCPLHASRFDHRGNRLEGPALRNLARAETSPLETVLRAGAAERAAGAGADAPPK